MLHNACGLYRRKVKADNKERNKQGNVKGKKKVERKKVEL
jgi:hypothetical protein